MSGGGSDRLASGGPWEERYGYSRAVKAGPFVLVSGCTSTVDQQVSHEGDPYEQTRTAFGVGLAALEHFGLGVADVVRTRMYVVHPGDAAEVGRAHRELFGDIRPAATMIVVAGLLEPNMLVEVELDAHRPEPS
jgi:enamine deaminase RidA (YjgF/YER057c/UK114 family)